MINVLEMDGTIFILHFEFCITTILKGIDNHGDY